MIYELLYPLSGKFGWASALNVLRYIPFRVIMATITAMVLCFLLAPWFIRELQKKQIGQVVRAEGPETHKIKAGTPTMGGALILLAVLVPTILWADVRNVFVVATAAVTAGFGVIGFIDDRMKIEARSSRGLPGRYKLLGQTVIGAGALSYGSCTSQRCPPTGWRCARGCRFRSWHFRSTPSICRSGSPSPSACSWWSR
jgi:phospho-N-acetylmuramoyl-pentapeptide-transferase